MTTKGIYHTLVTQLDKLARHNRQGSFRTKDRYYEAVKRFCAYLAAHYHLQKLENVSGKHLVSYVLYLQEQGKSASTIKTDLSAIRFFHDKMSHPRYTLPDNEELGVALERRRFGQQDRTWTNSEFGKLIGRAMAEEREDYILALYLARYAGLRIHECFRMDIAAAERALRENALTVKGNTGGDSDNRLQSRGSLPSSPKNRAATGFQRRIRLLAASTWASGIGSACANPGQ